MQFRGFRTWVSRAFVASFLAGGVAGAVSRTVVSPLERLKILLQVQSGAQSEYKIGVWKALRKMWQEEGMKGMMAGNGTNCVRIVPYSAVQFGSYNLYKPLVCILRVFYNKGKTGQRLIAVHSSSSPHPVPNYHLACASVAVLSQVLPRSP